MPSTLAKDTDYPRTTTKAHDPCARCDCRLIEDRTEDAPLTSFEIEVGLPGPITIRYRAPDPECGCTCHAAYRMVHGLPFDREAW